MKKLIFLTIIILNGYATICVAQEDSLITDKKPGKRDQLILDITFDNWLKLPAALTTQFRSPGITIAGMNDLVFGHSPFGFAFGLGFSSHNVHSNGTFEEKPATDSTPSYTHFVPLTTTYKKNKLVVNYIEIPMEFRFRTKGKTPFRLYAGFKGGYLVNIHTKIVDDQGKRKYYTFKNVNLYRYGITGRIGYGKINFTGFYALSTLFKEGRGEKLVPYSIGFSYFY